MKVNQNPESRLIDGLRQIEEGVRVEQLSYNGHYIWPLLKIKIYFDNWVLINSSTKIAVPLSLMARFVKILKHGIQFFINDLKNMKIPGRCDFLFFADPFNRRVTIDGKKFEIYLDPIVKKVSKQGSQVLVVERNAVDQYKFPRYTKSVPQFILQILFAPVLLKRIKLSDDVDSCLQQVRLELEKLGFSAQAIEPKQVRRYLSIFELHYKMYIFLLRVCRPKFVVLTEWYSIISMSMVLACKKQKVKSIEVQHGVQTAAHIAYGNFIKIPSVKMNLPFPDIFWVWQPEDKKNIDTVFSKYNCRGFVGGNLFLRQVVESEIFFKDEALLEPILKMNKDLCVVTLQPTYELHPKILNFIENNQDKYLFLVRLHPVMLGELQNYHEKLLKAFDNLQFEIELASTVPLVVLLKYAKLHVTFNSSAVLEAENFNVPSFIFDFDLAQHYFKDQILSGICQVYKGHSHNFSKLSTTLQKTIFEDIKKLEDL